MTRAEEGGEKRRPAFLRHTLNGGSRLFWIFYLVFLHFVSTCTTREPFFSWEMLTLFGPTNSSAPFSGGVSDVEPKQSLH